MDDYDEEYTSHEKEICECKICRKIRKKQEEEENLIISKVVQYRRNFTEKNVSIITEKMIRSGFWESLTDTEKFFLAKHVNDIFNPFDNSPRKLKVPYVKDFDDKYYGHNFERSLRDAKENEN